MTQETVDREVHELQLAIARLGAPNADGTFEVAFGKLYDETVDIFEALAGTLKAAKKRGIIAYAAPILLKGSHDKVPITLLVPAPEAH